MPEVKNNTPLVSILIPVYNREAYIGEAIKSAISQDYENIEIIISDNCSEDNTWAIIKELQEKDARVKLLRNEVNKGPILNWINCVEHARGEFACFLFSDDLFEPNYIREMLACLINKDSIGFVFSAVKIFNSTNQYRLAYNTINTGQYKTSAYIKGIMLNKHIPFSPGHALLRTKDIGANIIANIENKLELTLDRSGIGADLLLFLLTSLGYDHYYVLNKPLAKFRSHNDSITISSDKSILQLSYFATKTFFLERFYPKMRLVKKLNTIIFFKVIRYNRARSVVLNDFYQDLKFSKISITYFLYYPLKKFARIIFKHK